MATLRYYDWMITNPIMLFTTMALFKFQNIQDDENYYFLSQIHTRT